MKLDEYLKERGIVAKWFADKVPCNPSYLSRVRRGLMMPSPMMIKRIETLTKGKVKEEDFKEEDSE